MKKIELMALAVLLGFAVHADTQVVGGITWTYQIVDGEAWVGKGTTSSEAVPKSTAGDITVPSELGGCPVTVISDYAFYWRRSLTSVTIPEGVRSIGESAFGDDDALTSVTIPSSITNIGNAAFQYCSGLTALSIPEGVTIFNNSVFRDCSGLVSINVPSNLTFIGESAFNGCKSLESIEIPQGVLSIDYAAFSGCAALTTITIPQGVTNVGTSAFSKCSGLRAVAIPACVVRRSEAMSGTFPAAYQQITNVTIWSGAESIGAGAFCDCSALTSLSIPDGVTSIGNSAFAGCAALASLEIPSSVTSLGESVFSGCAGLVSIAIPQGVSALDMYAFKDCAGLTSMTIPSSVTNIGYGAFMGCRALQSVEIPSSVTGIGYGAFKNCSSLKSIEIPKSVKSFSYSVFDGCSSLVSLTIPDGVMKFAKGRERLSEIFGDIYQQVENVTILDDVTTIGDAFAYWSALKTVTLPASVTSIGDSAFYECTSLQSVTIPPSVNSIAGYAFSGCSSLESVVLPSSVTSIGYTAFRSCSALKTVFVEKNDGERIKGLLDASGFDTSDVRFVEIGTEGEYTEKFGGYTWHYCVSGGVAVVCAYANGDRAVTPAPNGMLKVPAYLGGCPVVGIDDYALQKDWNDEANWHLTEVEFPVSISYIGQHAFESCNELSKITIPEGVSNLVIGDNAFNGCVLTSVELPEGVISIGNFAFSTQYKSDGGGFTLSGTIILPSTLKAIGYGAFSTNRVDRVEFKGALPKLLPTPEGWTWLEPSYYGAFITSPDGTMPTVAYHSTYSESWQTALDECSPWVTFEVIEDPSLQTHAVTFDLGEHGTRTGGGELSQTVAHGGSAVAPVVTPDAGWTFKGWNSVFACVTSNMTVSATYQALTKPDGGPYVEKVEGIEWSFVVRDGKAVDCRPVDKDACRSTVAIPEKLGNCLVIGIGDRAFECCGELTAVTIPLGVTSIGELSFYNCGLASVIIPSNVTSIGAAAFEGCSKLKSVTIPPSVVNIGSSAFILCNKELVFFVEDGNAVYCTVEGVLCDKVKREIVCCPRSKNGEVSIPSEVESIGDCAFYYCSGITSVTMPSTVTTIGERAFFHCNGLISVSIPSSVVTIDENAFLNCSELKTVYVEKGDGTRIKALLEGSGFNTSVLRFCELGVSVIIVNDPSGKDWYVGDTYECEITTPVTEGGTQLVLSAWSVWNYTNLNVIASGTNSNVRFELENEGPYGIETVWQTNYWLEVSANGPGHVEGATSGWYAAGSEHSVHAQADDGAKVASYVSTVRVKSMNKQDTTLDVTFVVNRPSTFAVGFGLASYVVTFDLGEHGTRTGGGDLSQTVAHGGAAVAPTVAADAGWTFDGWDCEFADVRGDLTVTARYSATSYHIEYVNTQGVTNLNPRTYTVNDELTFAALPDLPTQRFAGWTPAGIARGTTGDLVVTGNWSRIKVQPIDNDPSGKDWYVGETYDYQIATPVTEGGTQLVLSAWSAWNYTNLNVIASDTNSNVRFYLENEGPYGIDLDWAKNYWLEIVASSNGTITGAESDWQPADSMAALTPVADAGYSFLRWTGDTEGCVETNGVLLVQMTQARRIGAEFTRVTHAVTFDLGEHGTRTGGGDLSQTVAHGGAAVAPVVAADAGWTFDGWDCEFADVRGDLTVTARYSAVSYHIEYVNTQGVTNLNPRTYTVNDEVTFAALPDLPTLHFAGWTPADIVRGTTGDLVVTGNWSRIKVQPIDNDPSGKDWYVGETYDYQIATPVTEGGTQLVLSAWSAWNYTNLNVIASDTNSNVRFYLENEGPYGIDLDWAKNYWLEIVASSNGTITGAESGWYAADSMVVLTPVADAGYSFLRWTGDTEGCVETNGVLLVQMTQARRIGAEFTRVTHAVTFDLGEHGTRTGGGDLSQTVAHGGAAVAPTVKPDTGWTFDGWDEDFSVVIADLTVRAQWKLTPVEPGKWNYDYTSAKTFADENDLPLVVFWTNPGCAQCERMTEAFETQKYRNWQASRDYVFVFSEGDASVKEFVKNDSGLYPFVAVQWPSQEIDVRFTARNGLMPVTEGDLVDQFTQSVDLSLFGVVLSVESDYGSPEPSVGDHLYMAGSIVTAAVEIVVKEPDERTQHVCVSGKGTGSVPATISSSGAVFEITEDSTLVWNWYTQNMLTILEPENGTIGGAESGWFLEDMSKTLTATPASGFKFNGWTGDTDGCAIVGNEITVPMSKPRQIGAEFSRITHTVTFDLGEHGMRTGGGELTQTVADGESAIAPAVTADEDWTFDGWDKDFSAVTADLTVTAKWSSAEAPHQKPDWTAPINLENWQVIYAKIYDRSSKTYLAHEEALLGAFDSSGNCIGHATIIPSLSLFQVNAGFDGGSISGVSLKYWDPERGEVEIRESLTLESGVNIGTISSPRIFDVGFIDMEIPLNQNFSWISIPLVLDDSSISTVFADCGLTDGDKVSAPGCSATLYGGKWYSSPETFVVKPGETYVVRKSSSGEAKLRVSGSPMNATAPVVSGWNWVGSMSVTNVPVDSLVHSAGFADDDTITGQGAGNVSSYLEGNWYGMDTLICGVGYKIKVSSPGSLSYDSAVLARKPMMLMAKSPKVLLALGAESVTPNWVPLLNKQNWQTIYGRVNAPSGSGYLGASGAKLAAFDSAGTCIGVCDFHAELSMFMLNVGFDGPSISGVTLKYWDSSLGIIDIDAKVTIKDGEDIGSIPNAEVYDCIVEEPIPELPQDPTADDVKNALDGSADAHLQECITEPTVYNAYRAWAETVKAPGGSTPAGAQAVKDSPNAWLSFALDSATLIQTPPADGDVKVEKFEQTAMAGSFDFTVGVENIPVGDDATPSNLAKVFGIEGGSTLSPQDMSFDKVDITFGTPENGKVKFTAGPKDKTQPTFFMKVKVK